MRRNGWARLTLLLWLALAGAADVLARDLFLASVPVAGQGQEERNEAIGRAMEKVLVKLTGSRAVSERQAARDLVADAPSLVQQYRYATAPAEGGEAVTDQRLLVVRFDEVALRQALRDRGLPAWGSSRPTLLLWLGVEEARSRRFFQPETDTDLLAAVERVAEDRGMAFVLPLMDVEDLAQLQASDLWGGFGGRVREASARYAPDLVLVGRVSRAGRNSRIDWQMWHGDRAEEWSSRDADRAAALASGLQETVDRIAARYAPVETGGDSTAVTVEVLGLDDIDGFVRVDRFLRAMDGVEQAGPVRVERDRALFRVSIRGGVDALSRAATLGRLLAPEPLGMAPPVAVADAGGSAPEPAPDLIFRLIR